jgi:dTDP-4-dehydrorhamnose 3,5-epimerase
MRIDLTSLGGVHVVTHTPFSDHRGYFERLFCDRELDSILGHRSIVAVNHSCTAQPGAVRGLHFQRPPHAEMKMVRCLRGRVFDVTVDLRVGSPTFLSWHAEELSADNRCMLVLPEGCAHGFQVLEPNSELLYFHTAAYVPQSEGGIRADDPALAIPWPLPFTDISARDFGHPLIGPDFAGIFTS